MARKYQTSQSTIEDSLTSNLPSNPEETGVPQRNIPYEYLITELKKVQDRVKNLESKVIPPEAFFKTATTINKTSLFVILAFPLTMLGILIISMIFYHGDDIFVSVVKWIIAIIGAPAVVAIFYVPFQLFSQDKRIREIERKLE